MLQDTEQADDYFLKYMGARAAAADAKAKEKEAAKNAALGKIMAVNPDFFYKHQKEIADQVAKTQQIGVMAMQNGASDPAMGADQYSQEYQRELNKLNQMSKFSKQIEAQFVERSKLIADNPDEYEAESIIGLNDYSDVSLADHMDKPLSPPTLKKRQPYADVMVMAGSIAEVMNKGKADGAQIDEASGRQLVREFLANPKDRENNLKSLTQAFSNLSDKEQADYTARSVNYGISGPELFLFELSKKSVPGQAPYNPAEAIQKSNFQRSYIKNAGAETYSTTVDQPATLAGALVLADSYMKETNDAFPQWMKYYNIDPAGKNEKELREETRQRIAKDLIAKDPKKTDFGIVSGSGNNPEQQKRATDWITKVYGDNGTTSQQALDVLRGTKIGNNLDVERAYFLPITNPLTGEMRRYVAIDATGPMVQKLTKSEIANMMGIPADQIKDVGSTLEQGQSRKRITLELTPQNAQFLQTLYIDADAKGQKWQGEEQLPGSTNPKLNSFAE